MTNNHNGVRFSAALGYLGQARHRLNLTVRPNCQARRILFQGNRASGLLVESGGQTFTIESEQIILSAGAVGFAPPVATLRRGSGRTIEEPGHSGGAGCPWSGA